ncbi:MAG TPA: hypothetical protein VGX52_12720 [Burkholderiales bacterium]|nr:hypothetical protein [Burkholderiales bacterium]
MKRGLLLTLTEPPPGMEEEFNAWYDEEHLPERLAIPGFRSARRWVADVAPGEGKYLATYELDSAGVLSSAAYLARYQHQTPWSRRCLDRCVVFKRWVCEQIEPGDADPHPAAKAVVFALRTMQLPSALQSRQFLASSGERISLHELAAMEQSSARVYRLYKS